MKRKRTKYKLRNHHAQITERLRLDDEDRETYTEGWVATEFGVVAIRASGFGTSFTMSYGDTLHVTKISRRLGPRTIVREAKRVAREIVRGAKEAAAC